VHEEALLMDILIDPHVVPHFVSYAFLASLILIGVAFAIRGSLALVPRGTRISSRSWLMRFSSSLRTISATSGGNSFFPS